FPTVPKAPYVLTSSNGSNEVFITCPGESRLSAGWMLSSATTPVTTQAVVIMGFDSSAFAAAAPALRTSRPGNSAAQNPSSKQASAGTIVSQFKNERLPLRI